MSLFSRINKILNLRYRAVIRRQRVNEWRAEHGRNRSPQNHGLESLEPRVLLSTTIELSSLLPENGGDGTAGFVVTGADTPDDNDRAGEVVNWAGISMVTVLTTCLSARVWRIVLVTFWMRVKVTSYLGRKMDLTRS